MKSMKKALSVSLALIMAFSVLTLACVNAAAYEQDSGSHYLLPTGDSAETAAKFALGETVYGALSGSEHRFYQVSNSPVRDLTLTVNTDQAIKVTVSTKDGAVFTVNEANVSTYTADVAAATVITLSNAPTGDYVIQIDGAGSDAEFSLRVWCENLPELKCNINQKTLDFSFSYSYYNGEPLCISDLTVNDLNYFWEVLDDSTTTDVDERRFVTVDGNGLVRVVPPSPGNYFTTELHVIVRAVFYYSTDSAPAEPCLYKSCTVILPPPNIYLDPYVTELTLRTNQTVTIKATTNVKNATLVWESSDPSIVSVSQQGEIHTYSKLGYATLTVDMRYNGEYTRVRREINVRIGNPPPPVFGSIQFEKKSVSVRPGWLDVNPKCTITYFDGTTAKPDGNNIVFVSANPNIATVNSKGVITGVSQGETTVTAMSPDGTLSADCTVKVDKPLPDWFILIVAPLKAILQIGEFIRDLIKS